MERKETVSVTAFKKWPFSNEFETECRRTGRMRQNAELVR